MKTRKIMVASSDGYIELPDLPCKVEGQHGVWYKKENSDWNIGLAKGNKLYNDNFHSGDNYQVIYYIEGNEESSKFSAGKYSLFCVNDMGDGCTLYTYVPKAMFGEDGNVYIDA